MGEMVSCLRPPLLARAFAHVLRRCPHRAATPPSRTLYSPPPATPLVDALEMLDQLPWWRSVPLRALGTFTPSQWQRAAGTDMYHSCAKQAKAPRLYSPEEGGVERDRFYGRFILTGLHCWLCHVRLREEPNEEWESLFREMMETLWEETLVGMCKGEGLDLIQASKFQKEMQLGWHGMVIALDKALESETPIESMQEALVRNVYADSEGDVPDTSTSASLWLAEYITAQRTHLAALPAAAVLKGRLSWAEAFAVHAPA